MGKFLKSFLFWIIILLWLFNFQNKEVSANSNKTKFIVTAYYSPIPNQKKYTTWSYAWDKRLNWEGHTTASWKWVYTWILAAPKKYPFWTKIYFDGFWVWAVEDRWWAIVKAGKRGYEYDRIDIWMWYWDEWLQRALKWWKRTITWRVVSPNQKVNLKFTKNILSWIENIKVNPENAKKEDVKKLQENFKKLKLYNWKIDWKYSSIKNSLINFQIKEKIIKNKNDQTAWWFWPKTYTALLRRYSSKDILIRQDNFEIIETSSKIQIILNSPEIKLNWDTPQIEEVKKVQQLFKNLWIYSWKIDWNYNSIKNKILEIQKQAKIIKNDKSWWAWYFWEKTKAWLIEYFEKQEINKKINKKTKISLDNISYKTLWIVARKLKNYNKFKKKILISKLEKSIKLLKKEEHKNKIKYLVEKIKI